MRRFLKSPKAAFGAAFGVGASACYAHFYLYVYPGAWREPDPTRLPTAQPAGPVAPTDASPSTTTTTTTTATGLKSAPRPAGDADPKFPGITAVVTDSFKELVLDTDKDVLLEVWMPTCRSCAALNPRIKMLASLLADVPSVRVATLNIDDNDNPPEVPEDGTPVLKLFPGKNKAAATCVPMFEELGSDSRGLPSVPDLLKFIAANASTPFTVTDAMTAQAEALETEALFLETARYRMAAIVNMWKAFVDKGSAAFPGGEEAFDKAMEDTRDTLFVAYHVIEDAAAGSKARVERALDAAEVTMRKYGVEKLWMEGVWITSEAEFVERVPAIVATNKPLFIGFGHGSMDTWNSSTGKYLKELGKSAGPGFHLAHVDCSYLSSLCTHCNASSPSVLLYRDGQYAAKVQWENPDLLKALVDVTVSHPAGPPLLTPPATPPTAPSSAPTDVTAQTTAAGGVWLTSVDDYMSKVPPLMASETTPVVMSFGRSDLKLWTDTDTGKYLSTLPDTGSVKVAHVDCATLGDLCQRCDSTAPSVHVYRGGSYVAKIHWEQLDLLRAAVGAVVANPNPTPDEGEKGTTPK